MACLAPAPIRTYIPHIAVTLFKKKSRQNCHLIRMALVKIAKWLGGSGSKNIYKRSDIMGLANFWNPAAKYRFRYAFAIPKDEWEKVKAELEEFVPCDVGTVGRVPYDL